LFAEASRRAFGFLAPFGHLGIAVDHEGQRGAAAGHAVQLGSAFVEEFAIVSAVGLRVDDDRSRTEMKFGRVHDDRAWAEHKVGRGDVGFAVGSGHAFALCVFQVSFLAEAADDAVLGADGARVGIGAGGRAGGAARVENFIFAALGDDWARALDTQERGDLWAFAGHDAFAVVIAEVSLFAGASRSADAGAHRVGVFAGAIAALALTEFFVVSAGFSRGQRDHRDFLGAFAGHDAAAVFADVSFLAGAAGDADARADRVGVLAGSIATFALTEFLVVAANLGRHGHGLSGWYSAFLRLHALALGVLQVAGFAEASDHALFGAHWAWIGVGAGRGACGSARHEHFVFFALRNFWWVGEEHVGLRGFTHAGFDAHAVGISQVSFLAKASDDAVLGADGARVGIGAGGRASGAAGVEFFIFRAFRDEFGLGELHGDFVGSGIAFVREHAFAHGVLQVSLLTETTDDALKGTNFGFFRMGAIRDASGSAGAKLLIGTALAFFGGKSRSGDSKTEGANCEQQQGSKAKGHR